MTSNEAETQRIRELDHAAKGRREGRQSRVGLAIAVAVLASCLIPASYAAGWLALVFAVQFADSAYFAAISKACARGRVWPRARLGAMMVVGLSTIVFAALGVALWQLGGNSGRIFAVLLFCGSLVHASVFLSQARFLYPVSVAPFILGLMAMPLYSLLGDHSMRFSGAMPIIGGALMFLFASKKSYAWVQQILQQQQDARAIAIWEKEKAEAANARLRSINRALNKHAMVAISDEHGVLLEVNDMFCKQSQYTREELIGRNHTILDSGYHDEAFFKEMQDTISAGEIWSGQIQNRAKDGTLYWSDVTISPELDNDGNVVSCISIRRDITDLHEAVAEAKRANAAKSEFLAMMSHELRTPMNAVLGMAQLLKNTELDPQQREYITAVTDGGEMLMTVLNDILDFSKIEAGKMQIENINVDVRHAVKRLERLWAPNARDKGLRFVCAIDDDVPSVVLGDITRIRQVIYNLLSNAVKFTQEGEVRLHVSAKAIGPEKTCLRFTVSDTGEGISEEAQKRLFSSFEQADKSTTRRFGGTGLGLAISKRLANLMDGDISVCSKPGEGSCFTFTLNAEVITAGSLEKESSSKQSELPAQQPEQRRRLRILAAEDNPLNQRVLLSFLKPLQHHVTVASDGQEALDLLKTQSFDLVLMDVQMPRKDGLTAARELRASGGPNATIPVIAMTANAMSGDRQKCLDAGMSDYVAKPIDPRVLFTAIAKATARRQASDEADGTPVSRRA